MVAGIGVVVVEEEVAEVGAFDEDVAVICGIASGGLGFSTL